ncbi:sigma factor-like helix-turn-helix DNA-binding protein [Bradyrhizobium elkanii]|uniref:sigma factor-like helix-turn-helix DNA-binding protein n=1 Tax=Bradyrhizobium elkanii TaxID=29448 RepID=UPI00209D8054|nr:sigma factor-like helix-turn-helix DNA-binding protein [Bradyrhizobium elkanii]MCP1971750.1 RNA polymerase sigma factor (sigma-70 family) [Bradyrhizobium elkanii]MCS3518899.1 RNA polymerase sigma factor (sigma-70 family) [Bradyrhizobium elkanii]MCS4075457.1 RNA polymerase sigma factor (sigma-70 family) [Bradyrhizobium elkanii]MCS4082090.1 RNA polymerase sigma factor (sigma-70 family) [Bradyrhizobium elkanii]MCS4106744.1 RNA polymerase sigma factor (sigma-70 family) [Bradyrhizobium elkanii]
MNVAIGDTEATEEWQDRLIDPTPDPESRLSESDDYHRRHVALTEALNTLPARQRAIVEARLLADEPKTLDELAREHGVSRERIRQIEARAVELIRSAVQAVSPKPELRPVVEPRRHAP